MDQYMGRKRNVDPWLISSMPFNHSVPGKKGMHYYGPTHANPVILQAKNAPIRTSAGEVIPRGYSAIVILIRYGGTGSSDWSIRIYEGLDTAQKIMYRSEIFD